MISNHVWKSWQLWLDRGYPSRIGLKGDDGARWSTVFINHINEGLVAITTNKCHQKHTGTHVHWLVYYVAVLLEPRKVRLPEPPSHRLHVLKEKKKLRSHGFTANDTQSMLLQSFKHTSLFTSCDVLVRLPAIAHSVASRRLPQQKRRGPQQSRLKEKHIKHKEAGLKRDYVNPCLFSGLSDAMLFLHIHSTFHICSLWAICDYGCLFWAKLYLWMTLWSEHTQTTPLTKMTGLVQRPATTTKETQLPNIPKMVHLWCITRTVINNGAKINPSRFSCSFESPDWWCFSAFRSQGSRCSVLSVSQHYDNLHA